MPISADPDTRIIDIDIAPTNGEVIVDIPKDLYSALKDDWHSTASLQKMRFPFRTFGDPIGAESIGPYVFFDNLSGWRIRPYDQDHDLIMRGNLVPESAVQGLTLPTFLSRAGRTIPIFLERSAQAISVGGSAQDTADAVWQGGSRTLTGIGSSGIASQASVQLISDIWAGRWEIDGSRMSLYAPDDCWESYREYRYSRRSCGGR